jgi:hypothetical protein
VKKPLPGSVVKTITGSYSHGYPRITQNVWLGQTCASTALGPEETNNLSASVVPIAAYAGKQMSVTFTKAETLPSADSFNVQFYDKKCNRIDVNDGKPDGGQWNAQLQKLTQAGMIPTGAAFVLLQTELNSTAFQASTEGASWKLVVHIPTKKDVKPTPMAVTGGVPV